MSVCRTQLRDLQTDMATHGATVTYAINVLPAAERMREWLYEQHVTMMHPERAALGQIFRNGKWMDDRRDLAEYVPEIAMALDAIAKAEGRS